jgi:serine/threonine protein kinase/Tfp pilus assembly protein PilF
MVNCPTPALLEQFLLDGLDELEQGVFESHIEDCGHCQELLQQISARAPAKIHPTLLDALSDADLLQSTADEAEFFDRLTQNVLSHQSLGTDDRARAMVDSLSGRELAGYEILEELGRGAVGVVYRARHLELNRLVALKIVLSGPHLSNISRQRFRQEAQAIARLRHPNIVQVYDFGESSGYPYVSLELIEGDNLARWLGGVPRPAAESARIVEVLAKAIGYAHSRGVIHRDLKPSNVLLGARKASFAEPSIADTHTAQWFEHDLKITDFGLAKIAPDSGGVEDSLTQSGMIMGTPAYIAPEQARGDTSGIGPAVDIYSLGAILYELLTGRPPFRGATPMETLLQAAHQEPTSLVRLAPHAPRDLQTICLKCLEKNVANRYATAWELAADLERFRKHEPILARPLGRVQRALRWVRRKPVPAAVISGIFLLLMALGAGAVSVKLKQAAMYRAEEENLREVDRLQSAGNWSQANSRLAQAKVLLGTGAPVQLQSRIESLDQNSRNYELLSRLDAIRLERAIVVQGPLNNSQADHDYETTFRDTGLMNAGDDAATVAARISESSIRAALLAAMDDWAVCTDNGDRRARLMEIARRVDPDVWRDRARDPVAWTNRGTLAELAKTAPLGEQSVQLLVALGNRLQATGGNAVEFLTRVQQAHPADFWANYFLGSALTKKKSPDAAGYFRAALAIRPDSAVVYDGLGSALRAVGRVDEAIEQYRRAIQLNPNYGWAYTSLGGALRAQGRLREAIEQYRRAVEIDPNYAWGHYVFANALRETCRLDEAIAHYHRAIEINPKLTQAYYDLGTALTYAGKLPEAIEQCEQALRINPNCGIAHYNIGLVLQIQGHLQESVEQFQSAIQVEPKLARAYEALGQSLIALDQFSAAEAATRHALQRLADDNPQRNHVAAQLDRCQRLAILEQRLPAVVDGTDRPIDDDDGLLLAELCFIKQQYDVSARLYRECFAAASQPRDELFRMDGFTAVRAAAQAAGYESDKLGADNDSKRLLNIRQSLTWMQATLDAWAELLDRIQAKSSDDQVPLRAQVLHRLSTWKFNPELVALRDPHSLKNLPPEESQKCRAVWDKLDALLRRAQYFNE